MKTAIEQIEEILQSDGLRRERLIEEFFEARRGLFARMSWQLSRRYGNLAGSQDDVLSAVMNEAVEMFFENLTDPLRFVQVINWEGLLTVRCAKAINRMVDDRQTHGMTRVSGLLKRRQAMARTRQSLQSQLGRIPTDQEIVDATNERLAWSRADQRRQGMICKIEDLHWNKSVDIESVTIDYETQFLLHPIEGSRIVSRTLKAAQQQGGLAGEVAHLWLSAYLENQPFPSILEMTKILKTRHPNITKTTVQSALTQVKLIARVLLAELEIDDSSFTSEVLPAGAEIDLKKWTG